MESHTIESISFANGIPTRGLVAAKAYEALEAIRAKHGELTDDLIISHAKSPKHPLHDWFDWDDTVAACEHRRLQARNLVRSFRVTYRELPKREIRAYQTVRQAEPKKQIRTAWATTAEALADPETRDWLIESLKRDILNLRRRLESMKQAAKLVAVMDEFLEAVT